MREAVSKNGSTPRPKGVVSKLGRALRGEPRKMSSPTSTSIRSSSPTQEDSEYQQMNSAGFSPTLKDEDVLVGSSSSSPISESSWSATSSGSHRERDREATLTIHYATYGTEEQAQKTAQTILWEMSVKGHFVVASYYNGIEIPIPERKP